jgi:hypothetical protein
VTTPGSACSESAETGGVQAVAGICSNGSSYLNSGACTGTWYTNNLTPTGGQEDYSTGNYSIAKGYMGAKSDTQVRWRLPTRSDYQLAEVDGIRFVMPDTGAVAGTNGRPSDGTLGAGTFLMWEVSGTTSSNARVYRSYFDARNGELQGTDTSPYNSARCVGR